MERYGGRFDPRLRGRLLRRSFRVDGQQLDGHCVENRKIPPMVDVFSIVRR